MNIQIWHIRGVAEDIIPKFIAPRREFQNLQRGQWIFGCHPLPPWRNVRTFPNSTNRSQQGSLFSQHPALWVNPRYQTDCWRSPLLRCWDKEGADTLTLLVTRQSCQSTELILAWEVVPTSQARISQNLNNKKFPNLTNKFWLTIHLQYVSTPSESPFNPFYFPQLHLLTIYELASTMGGCKTSGPCN